MNKVKLPLGLVFILSLFTTNLVLAESKNEIDISAMPDAQVFASFTDSLPAVLNYFTKAEQQTIIDFYQKNYGEIVSQETKRKRLTLIFNQNDNQIRVVISQQNKKRQVDVIVSKL